MKPIVDYIQKGITGFVWDHLYMGNMPSRFF